MRSLIRLAVSMTMMLAAASSFAGKREGRMQEMVKTLDLTEAQQKQMKELHEKNKAELKTKRAAKKAAFESLRTTLEKDDASDDQIRTAYQGLQTAKSNVAQARFDMMLEIRKVLTPEQRKKFREVMKAKIGKAQSKMRALYTEKMGDSDDDEGN